MTPATGLVLLNGVVRLTPNRSFYSTNPGDGRVLVQGTTSGLLIVTSEGVTSEGVTSEGVSTLAHAYLSGGCVGTAATWDGLW